MKNNKRYLMATLVVVLLAVPMIVQGATSEITFLVTSYDPAPAESGEYVDIWIKATNTGDIEARNFTVRFESNYPFSLDPTEEAERNYMRLGMTEDIVMKFKVRVDEDAIEGTNQIKLRYTTDGMNWFEQKLDISISTEKPNLVLGSVTSDPSKIKPGDSGVELNVQIQNIGDDNAQNVKTRMILLQGFDPSESYSDESNLGTVSAGSSGTATFYIDVDKNVAVGEYFADLEIQYTEEDFDSYKNKTLQVRIPVHAVPLFEIEKSEPETVIQGEKVSLHLWVINIGNEEAESVSISVIRKSDQPFSYDVKSDYIGNLKPGETGEAVLKFDVDGNAATKSYRLNVRIRAVGDRDIGDTNVYTYEKTVNFRVTERDGTMNWVIGAVVVVVVGGIGLQVYRKLKKK